MAETNLVNLRDIHSILLAYNRRAKPPSSHRELWAGHKLLKQWTMQKPLLARNGRVKLPNYHAVLLSETMRVSTLTFSAAIFVSQRQGVFLRNRRLSMAGRLHPKAVLQGWNRKPTILGVSIAESQQAGLAGWQLPLSKGASRSGRGPVAKTSCCSRAGVNHPFGSMLTRTISPVAAK